MTAIRALLILVLVLFYAGLEAMVMEGSPGMHSLHGRIILSALILLAAGVSCIAVIAATRRGSA